MSSVKRKKVLVNDVIYLGLSPASTAKLPCIYFGYVVFYICSRRTYHFWLSDSEIAHG